MPRKKKAGLLTNCQLCGTQVTVGNENRHAAFCDRRIETAAFVSTLTNSCITIPSSSHADVTNYSDIAGRTSDTGSILFPGDDHVHNESSKKRHRSSSRSRDHTSLKEPDVDHNLHLFPSGGSNNSDVMMDITNYLPDFCNDDNDPTSQYISTLQVQQTAASYYTDSLIPDLLNTHYPVGKN
jgi:hypothetical protein